MRTNAEKPGEPHRTVRVPFATLIHAIARWDDGSCLDDVVADMERDGMTRSLVVSDASNEGYELRLVRIDAGRASATLAPARIAAYHAASTWSSSAVSVAREKVGAVETFLAFNA